MALQLFVVAYKKLETFIMADRELLLSSSTPVLFLSLLSETRTLSSLALPSLAGATGRAAAPTGRGGAICPVFAQPFAGEERILQVWRPLFFPSDVPDGAPQTLTKLFVFESELQYITY